MKEVFIVIRHGGSHEDNMWQHSLLVTPNNQTALDFVKEMESEDALFNRLLAKTDLFSEQWSEAHPYPPFASEYEDYPRWPAGLKEHEITKEMRDERNAILARNAVRVEERNQILKKRDVEFEDALLAFMKAEDIPERFFGRFGVTCYARDWTYAIESIEYRE